MSHRGYRPSVRRKSNAEIKELHSLLDKEVTNEDWREQIRSLYRQAKDGNVRALQLLLAYRFGDPNAQVPSAHDVTPLTIIDYRGPESFAAGSSGSSDPK